MEIEERLNQIKTTIPQGVRLIAVSKTKPVEDIVSAYKAGQRDFGENKAQEMRLKQAVLPKDIVWHMIGHLQENKVKYIVPFVDTIHSVDSLKLLITIDKRASLCQRRVDCLFEMDISHEESKFGMSLAQLESLLSSPEFAEMENVRIRGLMGVGSITEDRNKTASEFAELKKMFLQTKEKFFKDKDYFDQISMGMSEDYEIAIEQGSTMVRIGSKIFGKRDYSKKI